MKIEFEKCSKPWNYETIDWLSEMGERFIVHTRESYEKYNNANYKVETMVSEKIATLTITNNIVVHSHCMFSPDENVELIGYVPIEFEAEGNPQIIF